MRMRVYTCAQGCHANGIAVDYSEFSLMTELFADFELANTIFHLGIGILIRLGANSLLINS